MISVILVDDEILVKVGLKSLIDWEKQGYKIIAEGENGEQGIELCKKYHPDLIITDIMMRPINGIEMIREIRKFNTEVQFIVLSGYDEFNLVKQALKLGALDYQLKLHTSAESLKELLVSIRPKFQEKEPAESGGGGLDSQSLSVLQLDFLKNLIGNVLPDKDYIDSKKETLRLKLHEQNLYISVIHTNLQPIVARYPSKDYKLFEFMVLEILREIGSEFFNGYFFSWSLGVFVMIFSVPSSEKEEDTMNKINDMAYVFQDMLREYFGFDFQVSTNGPCKGLESLHHAFEQTWIDATNGAGEPVAIANERGVIDKEDPGYAPEPKLRETLTHAFDILDIDVVKQSFADIFEHINQSSAKQICAVNTYCTRIVGFCDISLGVEFRNCCMENGIDINELASLNSKDDLLTWLKKYEHLVLEHLQSLALHKNILIENAKKYVQKNLTKRIVLNDVAEHLQISAGYLSSLFTKYEGIHFIDYVNNVKIEEAKKMLRTGNYKIYQVSYMLGYENSSYFSRIFKKVTGCAPKDLLH